MILIGNDAIRYEKRVIFQKGAEAIMKCKQIANDFVEKNGLKSGRTQKKSGPMAALFRNAGVAYAASFSTVMFIRT